MPGAVFLFLSLGSVSSVSAGGTFGELRAFLRQERQHLKELLEEMEGVDSKVAARKGQLEDGLRAYLAVEKHRH